VSPNAAHETAARMAAPKRSECFVVIAMISMIQMSDFRFLGDVAGSDYQAS
jgi:hypothetical protein